MSKSKVCPDCKQLKPYTEAWLEYQIKNAWDEKLVAALTRREERIKVEFAIRYLNVAHRQKGQSDTDNATDEYIDELVNILEQQLKALEADQK